MHVAKSFPIAPSRNASFGVTLRRLSSRFFSCSNIVYCKIGLMTSTRAGNTPANSALKPSSRIRLRSVQRVDGDLADLVSPPGSPFSLDPFFLAVILVLTTQIGLVIRTVALPARAPAMMLSMVVSFFEARPARVAARSNPALVHSYQ